MGNETVHAVADFDADKNWMSHHIFKNSQGDAGTIARDHTAVSIHSVFIHHLDTMIASQLSMPCYLTWVCQIILVCSHNMIFERRTWLLVKFLLIQDYKITEYYNYNATILSS